MLMKIRCFTRVVGRKSMKSRPRSRGRSAGFAVIPYIMLGILLIAGLVSALSSSSTDGSVEAEQARQTSIQTYAQAFAAINQISTCVRNIETADQEAFRGYPTWRANDAVNGNLMGSDERLIETVYCPSIRDSTTHFRMPLFDMGAAGDGALRPINGMRSYNSIRLDGRPPIRAVPVNGQWEYLRNAEGVSISIVLDPATSDSWVEMIMEPVWRKLGGSEQNDGNVITPTHPRNHVRLICDGRRLIYMVAKPQSNPDNAAHDDDYRCYN